jgi:hypothetical protein
MPKIFDRIAVRQSITDKTMELEKPVKYDSDVLGL